MTLRYAGITLCTAALAACTAAQQQAAITIGASLASYAAAHNTTAASLVHQGALICGKINSTTGQLVESSVVAVASAAGAPVTVLNQAASDVGAACDAIGLDAGPLPVAVNPATVPVVPVATPLPAVKA
jgi:hypothetical protein